MSTSSLRINNLTYEFACNLSNEKINKLLYKLFNENIVVVEKIIRNVSEHNEINWILSEYNLTLFLNNIDDKLSLRNKYNKVLLMDTVNYYFIDDTHEAHNINSSNMLKTFINSHYDAKFNHEYSRIKYKSSNYKVNLTMNVCSKIHTFIDTDMNTFIDTDMKLQKMNIFNIYFFLINNINYNIREVDDINQLCNNTLKQI